MVEWRTYETVWGTAYLQTINGLFICGVCHGGYPIGDLFGFAFMGIDKGPYKMSQPRCHKCAYVRNAGEQEPGTASAPDAE